MEENRDYQKEVLEWRWHQIRLRKKYAETPAGYKNEEQMIQEIDKWRADLKRFKNEKQHELLSGYQYSDAFFTGREELLAQMEEAFEMGKGPVILYGIGGIGKSAAARAYISRRGALYDHVLFLHFSGTIQKTLADDLAVDISNLQHDEEGGKGPREYFLIKYRVLKNIACRKKLLLVVDDCNVRKDRDFRRLFELPCDLIVTTRLNPEIWSKYGPYTGLAVTELGTKQEWHDFISGYRKRPFTADEQKLLSNYREQVQGHTLLMKLKIGNPGEPIGGYEKIKRNLLETYHLTKLEKKALTYLSVMPVQGIPQSLFFMISDIPHSVIDDLKGCLVIHMQWDENRKEEMLCLHPVIAEAVRSVFRPSCQNCSHFIRGWSDYLGGRKNGIETRSRSYLENQRLEPYVFALTEHFCRPAPWMAYALDEMVTFLWTQGYDKEAIQYSRKIFKAAENHYGEIHQTTGYMACRTSTAYYNSMDFDRALEWGKKAYSILKSCTLTDVDDYYFFSQACVRLAEIYQDTGKYLEALEMTEESMVYIETLQEKYPLQCFDMKLLKIKIMFQMGDLDIDHAINRYEELMLHKPSEACGGYRENELREYQVRLLAAKGRMDEAYQLSTEVTACTACYRGENGKETLLCKEELADICMELNKTGEAASLYEAISRQMQVNYPDRTEWMERICNKLNQATRLAD
jgi:tetratricopeptide (TPR) repeat protein